MANTSSAKKAHRAEARRRVFNLRRSKAMKDSVKETMKSKDAATLPKAQQAIDKALKRGLIKKNTASRMKARLAKQVSTK
ncbi:MAG: 30S ribosomal protein S20 [Minisyncoccia bacterium]